MENIFIIGSKGLPSKYGGYETFVSELTKNKTNDSVQYYVACQGAEKDNFEYHGAKCFNIKVPNIGPAKAIVYDIRAFKHCLEIIKKENIENPVIYILACRIGPMFKRLVKKAHKLGVKVYINPDGHEWKRSKWSAPVKKYWKISEKLMVKHCDLVICDSINIRKYINETYAKFIPNTTYIAYGAYEEPSKLEDNDPKVLDFYKKNKTQKNEYYLVVGRFVPENNYEIIIREFMKSKTKKDLVLVTNYEDNKFAKELQSNLHFYNDPRIKFVGTIYDKQLLKKIRENAFAYIHGHSVGGTNPSLLESLVSTKLNILYDVCFNKECANTSSIYFTKEENNLAYIIKLAESFSKEEIEEFGEKAKNEVATRYSWNFICNEYEELFTRRR